MCVFFIETRKKCVYFDIPPEDDGHITFVGYSLAEQEIVRTYFNNKLKDIVSSGMEASPNDMPEDIAKMLHFDAKDRLKFKLELFGPGDQLIHRKSLFYAKPDYVKNVKKLLKQKYNDDASESGLYYFCIQNLDSKALRLMFHSVAKEEQMKEEEYKRVRNEMESKIKVKRADMYRTKHIDPLERILNTAKALATSVDKELEYLATREERMRATSESTRHRVHMFSYLSLIVLVVVTGIQTFYFRYYFKKKKLM